MSEEEKKDEVVSTEDKVDNIKKTTNKSDKEVVTSAEADSKADKVEKKEETAEDLLGANIEQVKVRKAKGSKNITFWEFAMSLLHLIIQKFHSQI